MIKVIFLFRFRADRNPEDVRRSWLNEHGAIALRNLGMLRHVQNHFVGAIDEAHAGAGMGFDSCVEVWFEDREAYERTMAGPEWNAHPCNLLGMVRTSGAVQNESRVLSSERHDSSAVVNIWASPRMDRRDFLSSATLLALGLGAAACGGGSGSASSQAVSKDDLAARFAKYRVASEPNGDLAKVVWPSYVSNGPAEIKTLYEFQVTHGELMKWMPCFCGCGQSRAGHKSNRDCYIKRVRADGSVVFDSMAPT